MTNAIEAGQGAAAALRRLALMLDAGAASEKVLGQLAWLVPTRLPADSSARLAAAVDDARTGGARPPSTSPPRGHESAICSG